eukprot:TRINITY_DN10654_c0_g1_i1.p1 TRINITY_DN10654_c0_g1~~TRINITY_DN10654_c0_g1_i1.p1  ORF type:complete len:360 (+),score=108.04 TRINITY_DN10654_c0_g1_i1:105-1082(+)
MAAAGAEVASAQAPRAVHHLGRRCCGSPAAAQSAAAAAAAPGQPAAVGGAARSYKQHNEPAPERPGTEMFRLGKLYTVREMPGKRNKGKDYAVWEIHSDFSPHLLAAAAPALAAGGAFPGMFTRGEDGRPRNLRFTDAQADMRALQHLWLMVFAPQQEAGRWRDGLLESVLREAAAKHADRYSPDQEGEYVAVAHWGKRDDCSFGGDGTERGICYQVKGSNADVLLQLSALLGEAGYKYSGLVTSAPDGTPQQPELMVTIPASDAEGVKGFMQAARAAGSQAVSRYRQSVLEQLKQPAQRPGAPAAAEAAAAAEDGERAGRVAAQ